MKQHLTLKDNSFILVRLISKEDFGPILKKILKDNNPLEIEDVELFFYKTENEEIVISIPGVIPTILFIDFYETLLCATQKEKAEVTAWFYHDDKSIAGVRKQSEVMCQRASEECVKRHGGDLYLLVDSANDAYIQEIKSDAYLETHPETYELYKIDRNANHPEYEPWPNPLLEPLPLLEKGKYSYKTNDRNKLVEWIALPLICIVLFAVPSGILSYENTLLPWSFSLSTYLTALAIMALIVFAVRMKKRSKEYFSLIKIDTHSLDFKNMVYGIIDLVCEYLISISIILAVWGCLCFSVFGLNMFLPHDEQTLYCTATPMVVDKNGDVQIIQFDSPLHGLKYNYSSRIKSSEANLKINHPLSQHSQEFKVAYHIGFWGLPYIDF